MNPQSIPAHPRAWPRGLVLLVAAWLAYSTIPTLCESARIRARLDPSDPRAAFLDGPRRPIGHFPRLADSLLHGELSIPVDLSAGQRSDELIPSPRPGWFYCPYPPLPAILLMPFVAIFGAAVRVEIACRILSALNVLIFDKSLDGLAARLGRPPPRGAARIAILAFFALGTFVWYNAFMGGDWHLAHSLALSTSLLALREHLGPDRPIRVGLFTGLTLLVRPTAAIALLCFIALNSWRSGAKKLLALSLGPTLALGLLAAYNAERFGNPADFGYARMILWGHQRSDLERYGQFHPHFIATNAWWFFSAPPAPSDRFPFFAYDPRGMSLFIATPALLYFFIGLRRFWSQPVIRHAAFAILPCLLILLMYFNTGFWQFGHRFSQDYLPLLLIPTLAAILPRPRPIATILIILSIAINACGVLLDRAAPFKLTADPTLPVSAPHSAPSSRNLVNRILRKPARWLPTYTCGRARNHPPNADAHPITGLQPVG